MNVMVGERGTLLVSDSRVKNQGLNVRSSKLDVIGSLMFSLHKGLHFVEQYQQFRDVAKQRRLLSQMSEDQLNDIGISRAEALKEASKPFWK